MTVEYKSEEKLIDVLMPYHVESGEQTEVLHKIMHEFCMHQVIYLETSPKRDSMKMCASFGEYMFFFGAKVARNTDIKIFKDEK